MSPKRDSNKPPALRCHAPSNTAVVYHQGRSYALGARYAVAEGEPPARDRQGLPIQDRQGRTITAAAWEAHQVWLARHWFAGEQPAAVENATVTDLCAEYLSYADRYFVKDGEHTKQITIVRAVIAGLRALYPRLAVNDFGPRALEALRNYWLIGDKRNRSTVNKYVDQARRIFRWGVSKELVQPQTVVALDTLQHLQAGRSPAREGEGRTMIAWVHVEATLPYLPQTLADMVLLQLLTAARPDEICGLRRRDIDTQGEFWHGYPQLHKQEHKGAKRVLTFGPDAREILGRYVVRAPESYLFTPEEVARERNAGKAGRRPNQKPSETRTARKRGERYSSASYRRAITRAIETANLERAPDNQIPRWAPYQLRHTAATLIERQFGDSERASTFLGHSDPAVTRKHYIEQDTSAGDEIARAWGLGQIRGA